MKTTRAETTKVDFIEPMYALAVQNIPKGKKRLYEVNFDGYRCLAGRKSNTVTLWSRRGNIFTAQFPIIAGACERLAPGTLLDGEIVAVDKQGRVSFNPLQHHRSKAEALMFYSFDVLMCRGTSVLKEPLYVRREVLERIFARGLTPPLSLLATLEASPADLVRVVREFGFEVIVAKRRNSLYEPGKRSGAWLKYRVHKGQEFVIGGYVPDDLFDSIIIGYYQDGKLYYAAKVRNGFVPHTRKELFQHLKGLQTDACPFVNLPEKKRTQWALTREEMKNCVWVEPKVAVQIEFGEWTPDGHLRHSKFIGLRDDKDPDKVIVKRKPSGSTKHSTHIQFFYFTFLPVPRLKHLERQMSTSWDVWCVKPWSFHHFKAFLSGTYIASVF